MVKSRVPTYRTREKLEIWMGKADPVGFKFYGTFKKTKSYVPEHFEFSVIVEKRMNPRTMYFLVKETVKKMLEKKLPPEIDYKAYDGFMRLHALEWQKVHEVVAYDVKHTRT